MNEPRGRTLRIDVLTLFPEIFGPFLESSILGLAAARGLFECHLHDIRDYTEDRHQKVDDRPYGGGPGMVLACQPVFAACEAVAAMDGRPGRLIMLTPQGKPLEQADVRSLAGSERLILLCGRYEGFDERIRLGLNPEEVSIGDYVLTGGEVPAMVVIDAVVRLLPGAVGHREATARDSFSDGMLEGPQYTRPPEFRGMRVPEVLLSGHHAEIEKWRRMQAAERTRSRRADMTHTTHAERDNGES